MSALAQLTAPWAARRARRRLEADARAAVDFEVALPRRRPRPFDLAQVRALPGARSGVTLIYSTPDRRRFQLRQRLGVVPLAEEIEITGQTARRTDLGGRELFVVSGAHVGGEPIDGWQRQMTREILAWEEAGVICELEYRVDQVLEHAQMLEIADSIRTGRRGPGAAVTGRLARLRGKHGSAVTQGQGRRGPAPVERA